MMEPSGEFFVSSAMRAFYRTSEDGTHPVRSKGGGFHKPFRLENMDNEMKLRGAGRLAQNEQSSAPANDMAGSKPARERRGDPARDANVGAALRSVYAQTVEESVPDEFLDLLNKLD